MRKLFITGIGTDVGKTVAAAIVTEALKADYWKPVQTGSEDATDSNTIKGLISNVKTIIHPEQYCFAKPLSPHAAAELENSEIKLSEIKLPQIENDTLIIEGAGGVLVPLNDNEFIIDLITKLNAEVILVTRNYLGSINHTLLTFEFLKLKGIKVLGLIINGEPNPATERVILNYTGLKVLSRVFPEPEITKEVIKKYAASFAL
jgi:dethiobiotin synthetase